jgi:hypothetical protein
MSNEIGQCIGQVNNDLAGEFNEGLFVGKIVTSLRLFAE